ncbi:hypothetical protein V5799_023625 [Amblyomma americanum]|uniref:Uncharacterized protein n=1 Tax=Amblyomma americanum TaxID=6943 RepID=A0AAQ4FHF9_AMBAM
MLSFRNTGEQNAYAFSVCKVSCQNKVFEAFPVGIAVFDEDLDGDLDCLSSVRTDFDKESQKASYTWFLMGKNGHSRKNMTLHLRPGATPDKAVFTVDDSDGPWETAEFVYSDYQDCNIVDLPYEGTEQCIMWVSDEVKDDVPQECKDQFEYLCEIEVMAYDKDSCNAV